MQALVHKIRPLCQTTLWDALFLLLRRQPRLAPQTKALDVILVGPYPPPFGGISAHIARLTEAIQAEGMTVGVLNHFCTRDDDPVVLGNLRRNPLRYWHALRSVDARIVHYHHSRWSTLLAAALALRGSPSCTMATIHSSGEDFARLLRSPVPGVARVTRRALKAFDILIAVSVEAEQVLRPVVDQPTRVIPAYVPVSSDHLMLSPETAAFLQRGVNLLVAAYRLSVDRSGRTIYGLETAIDSFKALAPSRPDLHLAVFLASAPKSRRETDRLRGLLERVDDSNVRSRIGVFCGEPLTPALRMAALYLRPTLTDGDAVSIREAIDAGVPVLASDVVVRPPSVSTLPLKPGCWTTAIEEMLAGPHHIDAKPVAGDSLAELLGTYRQASACPPGRFRYDVVSDGEHA
jgi:glycosyltransferase involved in cell wall biosynthesis